MTHSHPAPSSIRDDSICESSPPPNKSSADIGERLRYLSSPAAEQLSDFQRINAFVQIGHESAAEIERLRRELDAANSNHRSMAHQLAETGIRLEHAESAVAAAWEAAAKIAETFFRGSTQKEGLGMSEGSETELRPHTRRMKGHLIDAINASSQGADFRMSVSQQLLDDLQEAILVLSLVDLGKSHLLEANSHTEPT